MKLKIKEIFWGINHRTGDRSERVTADVSFPCEVGDVPLFGNGRRHFTIDEIQEDSIVLSVHYENSKYDKSWTLKKGEETGYMPRSFDGGYKYKFKLV